VNSRDLGLLLGRTSSPDEVSIRRRLNGISEYKPSEELIEYFADLFLTLGFIEREVFFIDGHFLPYYGLKAVAKGYFTVRRQALKGNEIYVVSDLKGRPLFSITEGCDVDFRPIIAAALKLIDLGIPRPLLVFDRGGYGVHFFSRLIKNADFIIWAKYLKKEELKGLEYTSCLRFKDSKYLIAERKKTIKESVIVRMVVFKEINGGPAVAIYTSDHKKPAGDIAYFMLSRWGESENFFKEIMSIYNFNYHPGYDIKELDKQPYVDNPQVKTIKRTIKGIKQKIGQLVFEKLKTEEKLRNRKDIRLDKKLTNLQNEVEDFNQELINFTSKLEEIPDKIPITELLQDKVMSKADLEKKKLYDLLQMIAFHSREHLIQIFRSCYKDPRDVKQVLTMITRLSGYVKLAGKSRKDTSCTIR